MTKTENSTQSTRSILKALVIIPNEQTREYGSLIAIARSEACKREHTDKNPPILALKFFPELGVYVAVYGAQEIQKIEVKRQGG
jgi:hypothetical protein